MITVIRTATAFPGMTGEAISWAKEPPSQRSAFLEAIAVEVARLPPDGRGPGSLSCIARDMQHLPQEWPGRGPSQAGRQVRPRGHTAKMKRERRVLEWFDDGGVWIARASRDVVKPVREACVARMSEAISGSSRWFTPHVAPPMRDTWRRPFHCEE